MTLKWTRVTHTDPHKIETVTPGGDKVWLTENHDHTSWLFCQNRYPMIDTETDDLIEAQARAEHWLFSDEG